MLCLSVFVSGPAASVVIEGEAETTSDGDDPTTEEDYNQPITTALKEDEERIATSTVALIHPTPVPVIRATQSSASSADRSKNVSTHVGGGTSVPGLFWLLCILAVCPALTVNAM